MSKEDPVSANELPSRNPSILQEVKTVTLEFVKFKRKASSTAQSGAIGFGIMAGAVAGPLAVIPGMGFGLVLGEVVHARVNRSEA